MIEGRKEKKTKNEKPRSRWSQRRDATPRNDRRIAGLFLRSMRALQPTLRALLSRTRAPPRRERASSTRSTTKGRNLSLASMSFSSSPPAPPPPPLPFDGSARRGGLLHPRFQDPAASPPAGEEAPPVRASQQRCSKCGGELSVSWLEGRWRHACVGGGGGSSGDGASSSSPPPPPPSSSEVGGGGGCGTIAYTNPLLVVGAIITDVDAFPSESETTATATTITTETETRRKPKVLLCKRAIEPRKGSWTLPAGYLELGESAAAGAARETWEEARARVEIFGPYFHAVSRFCFFVFF